MNVEDKQVNPKKKKTTQIYVYELSVTAKLSEPENRIMIRRT